MPELPEAYRARMRGQLGEAEFAAYLRAMESYPKRALRVNTLKTNTEAFREKADFPLFPTGLLPESFFFEDSVAIGKHPLHAAGLCYVQEPSAQMPATLSGAKPGLAVLDLCAAPGGKTTQLAALMRNTGVLVANEPVRSRAETLVGNLERLGVRNTIVTCMRPDALAALTGPCFDVVLVDAPCSGEGMFRKDEIAIREWSEEHVLACAVRQGQILSSAARMLQQGGRLVYSTCTFSQAENEGVIASFLSGNPDFRWIEQRRMYPHSSPGEGQFMAALEREGTRRNDAGMFIAPKTERVPAFEAFWRETFVGEPPETLLLPDGRVLLPPKQLPRDFRGLQILRAGVLAGELKNGRFSPDHALVMAYPAESFLRAVSLSDRELVRFLAGETATCALPLRGWCAVTALGFPVGWGKAVDGVLKNHIPKGLRIR